MMAIDQGSDRPLTSEQLADRPSLSAEGTPPTNLVLNQGTFRLPPGATARLVSLPNAPDTYQIQVDIRADTFGQRAPFDSIPATPLTREQVPEGEPADIEGIHPSHLPLSFVPSRIDLPLSERARPPFDFDYVRDDEILDRPTNVFTPDDRYIYRDAAFPWCTIGRVDTALGYCTGCTIGPRLLLTANHQIQWNADGTAGWVRFRPAYYNGSVPFGEAWAVETLFWTTVTGGDGLSNQETAFDYVVCVLDSPIGDVVGYPGARTYREEWNGDDPWQHMGYPSDLTGGERPAFHGQAVVSSVEGRQTAGRTGSVLGHFNDIVGGHSGGPVWGWWGEEPWPRVVGTQSTEANVPNDSTSGDNEFGGGLALTQLIQWARDNRP